MEKTIKCKYCGESFIPQKKQKKFLEESKKKGMSFIMLDCLACGQLLSVNPLTWEEPRVNNTPPPHLRCPVSGCSGWVVLVAPQNIDQSFWGCGECGTIWYKKEELFKSIDKILNKFSYRRNSYTKMGEEYYPSALELEEKNYEQLVENEKIN